MTTADFSRGLPDLRAGVYRHWKGRHYLVLGYAHDANADMIRPIHKHGDRQAPFGERAVVVYLGLELDDAHKGPRLAVRTAEDFFALVCSACGDPWECQSQHEGRPVGPIGRFEYLGPAWYGWSRVGGIPSGTPSATLPADPPPGTGPGHQRAPGMGTVQRDGRPRTARPH